MTIPLFCSLLVFLYFILFYFVRDSLTIAAWGVAMSLNVNSISVSNNTTIKHKVSDIEETFGPPCAFHT